MELWMMLLIAAGAGAGWLVLACSFLRATGGTGWMTRAPGVDVVMALLTWVPWIAAGVWGGWPALLGVVLGQVVGLLLWVSGHELLNREHVKGPRIVSFINREIGPFRNHAALWVTAVVLPVFLLIRVAEMLLYPMLVRLLDFPKYNQGEWVNVSRQKFNGLVGHDLVWCLYCDWMTGVYALGAEMLRNVESFWCPIRFASGAKCENCKLDFPDVVKGWAPANGTMADVERALEAHYGETGVHGPRRREWFGHPARLTVNGAAVNGQGAPMPGGNGPRHEEGAQRVDGAGDGATIQR